jgi:hypothetical protein
MRVRRCVVVAVACFPKEFVGPIPSWVQDTLKEKVLGFGLGLSRFVAGFLSRVMAKDIPGPCYFR